MLPGCERTVLEVVHIVLDLIGAGSQIRFTEAAVADDPQRRRPDIAGAKRLLGWEPRVPLRDGLGPTIAYFRDELDISATVAPPPASRLADDL